MEEVKLRTATIMSPVAERITVVLREAGVSMAAINVGTQEEAEDIAKQWQDGTYQLLTER